MRNKKAAEPYRRCAQEKCTVAKMFPPEFEMKRTSVLDLVLNQDQVIKDMEEVMDLYALNFNKCKAACESDGDYLLLSIYSIRLYAKQYVNSS